MVRVPGCDAVYDVANQWRDRCLADDKSLLWPEEVTWTVENLERTREVMDSLVAAKKTTGGDMKGAFEQEPDSVRRTIADATAVWNLCPGSITPDNRKGFVSMVAAWGGKTEVLPQVHEAIDANVGAEEARFFPPGFQLQRGAHLRFVLEFARTLKTEGIDPHDRLSCMTLAQQLLKVVSRSHSARNMVFHLLYPDFYEAVFNNWAKDQIVHSPRLSGYAN